MESFLPLFILALLGVLLLRLLFVPMGLLLKLLTHSGCGFLCLWLLNTASGFTGVFIPVNAVTATMAGFFGLPGIALLTLLELWA